MVAKFKDVLNSLSIKEKFTKETRKPDSFNNVSANVPAKANYNHMSDVLFLPESAKGKYLLVVVDLATNAFDIEPMHDKSSYTVLKALKQIYKRKYVKKPFGSFQSDSGTEYKSVVKDWLYDESILHKVALPNRHSQNSVVESLNKSLARLFMGYLNTLEEKTGKVQRDWSVIIPTVREKLNEYRANKRDFDDVEFPNDDHFFNAQFDSKYAIGDIVYYKLDWAESALGHKQPTPNFRAGDSRYSRVPKKIKKVILMNTKPYYRYVLESLPNVSYTEQQLMKAGKKETDTKYKVKQIIDDKMIGGKKHYKIWWEGEKKNQATFEPATELIKDGLKSMIDEYNNL